MKNHRIPEAIVAAILVIGAVSAALTASLYLSSRTNQTSSTPPVVTDDADSHFEDDDTPIDRDLLDNSIGEDIDTSTIRYLADEDTEANSANTDTTDSQAEPDTDSIAEISETITATPVITRASKVKILQDYVKKYAWPSYSKEKTAQTSSYESTCRGAKIGSNLNYGNNAGVYVRLVIQRSGWDTSYKGTVAEQYNYLNQSSNWYEVTDSIKSNAKAQPGDIIIHAKDTKNTINNVLLYHGNLSGFTSNLSSAAKAHAPMSDKQTDITHYVSLGYHVFRMKTHVSSISLNKSSAKIERGKTITLTATVQPSDATNKTIFWSSSDNSIASVNNGKVTGKKSGTVTITATSDNGKKATAKISVTVPSTKIVLNKSAILIRAGATSTIQATITPSDAFPKTTTWTSSNPDVAYAKNSKITGIKSGTATITATTDNGKKTTLKVTVISTKRAQKIAKLQSYVKNYAWPTYRDPIKGGDGSKMARMSAYETARLRANIGSDLSKGNNCGVYVRLLVKNSGWDTKYKQGSVAQQYDYLRGKYKDSNRWTDVTTKIKSNSDAQPGDIIIGTKEFSTHNHVLIYNGSISGFSSAMSSAASKERAPMADKQSDIMYYIHEKYKVFRLN